MTTLILIIIMAAIYHFVCESILMPTFRHNLRYRLFSLRDELRLLKLDKGNGLDDELFDTVDASISASIKYLPFVGVVEYIRATHEYVNNGTLRKKIEKRIEFILNSATKNQEVFMIYAKSIRYASWAILANSCGILIYLTPIFSLMIPIFLLALLFLGIDKLWRGIKEMIKERVQKIVLVPEKDIRHVFGVQLTLD